MSNNKTGAKTPGDFFYDLPKKRQHIIALVILFLVPFIIFTATTIGGKQFLGHDSIQFRAGADSIYEYRESTGEEPLWSTNMFSGMPATVISVERAVPHLDTILNKIFKGIFPAYYYWVMLFGCYLMFTLLGTRSLTSVIGSLLFGLTTYIPIIIGAGHNTKFAALAYMPLVICSYLILTRTDKKLLGFFMFALTLFFQLRAGHPQITYYFIFFFAVLYIYDSVQAKKEDRLAEWGKVTAFLFIGLILSVGAHLDNYWQLYEYSAYSNRGGSAVIGNNSGLDSGYAYRWSQGVFESFTLLIPDLFGGAQYYWGEKPGTAGPHYLGIIAFIFLVIALLKNRTPMVLIFTGVGFLSLMFGWGRHFAFFNDIMYSYFPLFDKFRAPETWLVLTTFCFGAASVFGLDWFLNQVEEKGKAVFKDLYIPIGVVAVVALSFIFITKNSLDYQRPNELNSIAAQIGAQNNLPANNPQVQSSARRYVQTNLVPEREGKAQADAIRLLVFVIILIALIYFTSNKKIAPGLFSFILIVLVGADMIPVDKRYVPDDRLEEKQESRKVFIDQRTKAIDVFLRDEVKAENEAYSYRVLPLTDDPFNNNFPSYFYPSIGGYSGAKLSIYADVIDPEGPLFANGELNIGLLGMLNGKYFKYSPNYRNPDLEIIYNDADGAVFENKKTLPKAFFVDSLVTTEFPDEAYQFLFNNLDAKSVSIVETTKDLSFGKDSTATTSVTTYGPREIVVETNSSEDGFLALSEIYYPKGWKAFIDDEETEIFKTNYLIRGVEVPSGNHTISFRYDPASYIWGSRVAWISNIFILLIGVAAFFESRKKSE